MFDKDFITYGGAIGLYNDLFFPNSKLQISDARNLSIKVINTSFIENTAMDGGAFKLTSLAALTSENPMSAVCFYFENSIFTGNVATSGAALSIVELKHNAQIIGIQVHFKSITVTQNVILALDSPVAIFTADSSGALDLRAVNTTLSGKCVFSDNIGTALMNTQSLIGILGDIEFANNTGLFGGAMHLNGYLIVLPKSTLEFIGNVGRIRGSAIYTNNARSFSPLDCFLYFNYDEFNYCDTCDFSTNNFSVRFINNSGSGVGGTIYGSSLSACPWARPLLNNSSQRSVFQILDEDFPQLFEFQPKPMGINVIQSPLARISIVDEQPVYTLVPGESRELTIQAFDSLGQRITALFSSYVSLDRSNVPNTFFSVLGSGYQLVFNGTDQSTSLTVKGAENISSKIVIYALDDLDNQPVQVEIQVNVTECPQGFIFSQTTGVCTCSEILLGRRIQCNVANLTLLVPIGLWVGPVDSSEFAVADCIRGLCEPGEAHLFVTNGSVNYDLQCKPGLNRGGILCSSCLNGYSNVFGSDRCERCSNSNAAILLLFMLLGVLIILFLVHLRINLSTGYFNGVLFYANIVSLYGNVLVPIQSYSSRVLLANWLSLNWGIETCFHKEMSALERNWWQLSFPLYLFFLMALTHFLFNTRRFKRVSTNTAFATIETFATLLIVCYVSILQFCFEMLSVAEVYTVDGQKLLRWRADPTVKYFTGAHGFLAFMACLLLLFYIIPFPLVLLFPTLLYKSAFLKKYKPIYDAFWNPFKPKLRLWLGVRLIFRWIPFLMANFFAPPTSTFVTSVFLVALLFIQMQLRPFQVSWNNTIDSLFLLNLILLFLGSLFFSNSGSTDLQVQQASYSNANYTTVLVNFAYIGISVLFTYHLLSRFPKLKLCLRKCLKACKKKKRKVVTVPQILPEPEECTVVPPQPALKYISHTSFREPLLDEGSVEIETRYVTT